MQAAPEVRGNSKSVKSLLAWLTWAKDDKPVDSPAGLLEVREQLRRICRSIVQQKDPEKMQALENAKALLIRKPDAGKEFAPSRHQKVVIGTLARPSGSANMSNMSIMSNTSSYS